MAISMPMHEIWNPELATGDRSQMIDDFTRRNDVVCKRTFLSAQYASWHLYVGTPWLLALKPEGWSDADLADCLGIDEGQISRYRAGLQVPSAAVLYQWLRFFHKSPLELPISQSPLFAAFGIAACVRSLRWKERTRGLPDLRRQRTPASPVMSVADVALAYSLISDNQLRERWIEIAWRHRADLEQAIDEPRLLRLLPDIIEKAIHVISTAGEVGSGSGPANRDLSSIDLRGNGAKGFIERIRSFWAPYQFTWFCTHDCTSDLFFDLI